MSDAPGFILILERGLPPTQRNRIRRRLEALGATVQFVSGGVHPVLEVFGDTISISTLKPEIWPGVVKRVELTSPHPHAAWGLGRGEGATADSPMLPTVVTIPRPGGGGESASDDPGFIEIGPGALTVLAGPCAVEDPEATLSLAHELAGLGVEVFRAGAFKPRTSPYAFQGAGDAGLEVLKAVREEVGLAVVTEILEIGQLDKLSEAADILQVGARNMHNFTLLKELGQCRMPILLKRGFAATVSEFLLAAEYILAGGNESVILCERGLRLAAGSEGVVLDLGAIPELRRATHLPIVVDPSHGGGRAYRVPALARAAVAAGADGILIEVHADPASALSDGQQALDLTTFQVTLAELAAMRQALNGCSAPGAAV